VSADVAFERELNCENVVELRGFEPLTFSMRTRRTGRLRRLIPRAVLTVPRSEGWRRWLLASAAGATADGLRTLARSDRQRESGRWPCEAGAARGRGSPPSPIAAGAATLICGTCWDVRAVGVAGAGSTPTGHDAQRLRRGRVRFGGVSDEMEARCCGELEDFVSQCEVAEVGVGEPLGGVSVRGDVVGGPAGAELGASGSEFAHHLGDGC
jgi:hypothetical protein